MHDNYCSLCIIIIVQYALYLLFIMHYNYRTIHIMHYNYCSIHIKHYSLKTLLPNGYWPWEQKFNKKQEIVQYRNYALYWMLCR